MRSIEVRRWSLGRPYSAIMGREAAYFLAKIDARAGPDCVLSERDARQALAWENTYRRTLQALGLVPRANQAPRLHEVLGQGGAA